MKKKFILEALIVYCMIKLILCMFVCGNEILLQIYFYYKSGAVSNNCSILFNTESCSMSKWPSSA